MVMKSTTLCLLALALFGSLCDAQSYKPHKPGFQKPSTPQQSKQSFEKPLTWEYPDPPAPKPKIEVDFELRYPVTPSTVAVECRESTARVEAKRDFFGTGQLINPDDLTLGDCPVLAEDPVAQVLIFETELHGCGGQSMMLEESFVYGFVLNYNPKASGDSSVVRTSKATVIVECYYARKHNVSSLAIQPMYSPYYAIKVAEEFLYFSLTLKTENWMNDRPAYQYFLGEMIHIEASVEEYYHVPLRVFLHSCVGTLSDDPNSSPRYAFIESGCLVDSTEENSASRFRPRTKDSVLELELDAFRFDNTESDWVYITCHLMATTAQYPIDSDHRACYFDHGWKEASGVDNVCHSCPMITSKKGSDVFHTGGAWSGGGGGGVGGGGGGAWSAGGGGGGTSWNPGSASGGSTVFARKTRDVSKKDGVKYEGLVRIGPIAVKNLPAS